MIVKGRKRVVLRAPSSYRIWVRIRICYRKKNAGITLSVTSFKRLTTYRLFSKLRNLFTGNSNWNCSLLIIFVILHRGWHVKPVVIVLVESLWSTRHPSHLVLFLLKYPGRLENFVHLRNSEGKAPVEYQSFVKKFEVLRFINIDKRVEIVPFVFNCMYSCAKTLGNIIMPELLT